MFLHRLGRKKKKTLVSISFILFCIIVLLKENDEAAKSFNQVPLTRRSNKESPPHPPPHPSSLAALVSISGRSQTETESAIDHTTPWTAKTSSFATTEPEYFSLSNLFFHIKIKPHCNGSTRSLQITNLKLSQIVFSNYTFNSSCFSTTDVIFFCVFLFKFSMWSVVLRVRIFLPPFFLVLWGGQCSDTKNHLPSKS